LVQALRRQDWPGNVRELENTIEKLYVLSPANVVPLDGFAQELAQGAPARLVQPGGFSTPNPSYGGGAASPAAQSPDDAIRALVGLPVDEVERRLILATLAQVGGNKSKAARQLQIGLKTLYRKLEGYGVPVGE
ncbi:MAG: hypothetical protein H0X45_10485, partial [Planctomycetes bacterium]|nr:hypothetical protein [Planctomycetota bacterium]